MTSTMERGRRRMQTGGRSQRTVIKQRLGAAGRLMGSLARSAAMPAAEQAVAQLEQDRRAIEGVVEVEVLPGETVADVAARHGVSTASVLALNELGWRTPVHAGQHLLVKPALRPAVQTTDDLHRHRVAKGESVTVIAERHGLAPAAVLLANGLSRGAVVLPGQQLVIPVPNARRSGPVVRLSGDMRANAHLIVDAGRALCVPDDGLVVALAAAMEDSSLQNLGFGEADAVGVFQQRPSDGWGVDGVLLDPYRAALAFFGDPEALVVAPAVGLLDVPGWQLMSVGEAAVAVQRGGTAAAYGKWERCAREWLGELDRESGRC